MDIEKSRIEEIWRLHGRFIETLKKSLEYGIKIGALLMEQKSVLKHGQFGAWIEKTLPFSKRTAQNYMRIYRERDRLKNATVSHLTEAYRVLEEPEEDGGLLSDLPADMLRDIIKNVNAEINDERYAIRERTGWFFRNLDLEDDGSMTEDEMTRFELAMNIQQHNCFYRHHIWHYGKDSLPAVLVYYIKEIGGEDIDSKPKSMCADECRQE